MIMFAIQPNTTKYKQNSLLCDTPMYYLISVFEYYIAEFHTHFVVYTSFDYI
jgi:hypothetical protein